MTTAPAVLDISPRQALESLRKGFGLSDDDVAGAAGTTVRTLKRWKANAAYPQQAARQKLARLLQLQERVQETFEGDDAAQRWAQGASRYLGGVTPAEAIRAGRIDRAEAALGAFLAGIYL
jgi:transcriptional regulator with XRE-family HTH domain